MKTARLRQYIDIAIGLVTSSVVLFAQVSWGQQKLNTVRPRILPSSVRAPSQNSIKMTAPKPAVPLSESGLSGTVTLSYSQNLVDYQDGGKESSGAGRFSLSGDLTSTWRLRGRIGFEQDLKDAENDSNGVSDLSLELRNKTYDLARWLTGKWFITGSYPLSDYSIRYQNFQGSIGTRYKFGLTQEVLAKGMNLSFSLGGTRNFYKYDTDIAGKILSPYSIRESFVVGYDVRRWDLSASFSHAHRFNFENRVSQSFELEQEIGYSFRPDVFRVAVGHTNSGSWLKSNEQDSNLEWINENNSVVYAQTEVSF